MVARPALIKTFADTAGWIDRQTQPLSLRQCAASLAKNFPMMWTAAGDSAEDRQALIQVLADQMLRMSRQTDGGSAMALARADGVNWLAETLRHAVGDDKGLIPATLSSELAQAGQLLQQHAGSDKALNRAAQAYISASTKLAVKTAPPPASLPAPQPQA